MKFFRRRGKVNDMAETKTYWDRQAQEADERAKEFVEAVQSGMTYEQIAARSGLTTGRISQIIKRARERGLVPDKNGS